MIRRLERRMILLVLAAVLAVSAGLVGAVDLLNRRNIESGIAATLRTLSENGGERPMERRGYMPGAEFTGQLKENMPSPGRSQGFGQPERVDLTTFYTIRLDGENAVTEWHSDRSDLYTDEEIAMLAAKVAEADGDFGKIGTQYYRRTNVDDGTLIVVVDARMQLDSANQVLRFTAMVALAADLLLSAGAVVLIRRMVRPVDEAFEKQKQFVWDASHELKTPLAVISANAQALSAEIGPNESLDYIESEVQRSDRLLGSLLTLARMDKGTAKAKPAPFDLSRAVLGVTLPFESAVFEKGKTLEIDVPEGITLTGDEDMIKQLVVILLSNAEKYSDAHGRIAVKLRRKGDRRILTVFNTGPVIPKEDRERIFDRFYRLDTSHNRDIEGSGLGLAIARSICDAHRARITVSGQEGEGTTFTVTF